MTTESAKSRVKAFTERKDRCSHTANYLWCCCTKTQILSMCSLLAWCWWTPWSILGQAGCWHFCLTVMPQCYSWDINTGTLMSGWSCKHCHFCNDRPLKCNCRALLFESSQFTGLAFESDKFVQHVFFFKPRKYEYWPIYGVIQKTNKALNSLF